MAAIDNPYVTPRYSWRTPVSGDDNWYTEQASMLSSIDDDLFNCSATASAGNVLVQGNSAYWNSTHQTVSSNSAYWNSTHQTVSANSSDWEAATTEVENGSAYWNSTHQTASANSGNWNSSYTTVNITSGSWTANPVDWPAWNATEIAWDSGWIMPVANQASHDRLPHGLGSEPDIAFLWAKGISDRGEQIMTAQWDFAAGAHGCRIVEYNTTNITIHGLENTIYDRAELQGDADLNYYRSPVFRVLGINKTADYDSGWESMSATNAGTQVTVAHGIGTTPDFYTLEFSDSSPVSGNRGYLMFGSRQYNGAMATTIVDVDATNIIFSLSVTQIAHYYGYDNGEVDDTVLPGQPYTGWWYRVKAWDWAPSYTSDWTFFDSAHTVMVFHHAQEKVPFLYLLEFSKANDGSDDIVPLMTTDSENDGGPAAGDNGVHLQWIGERYATVHYPHNNGYAASYEDSNGIAQNLTTGYIRLKVWA